MLKVWHGRVFGYAKDNRSVEALVAAHSQKHAIELLEKIHNRASLNDFRNYWVNLCNDAMLKIATEFGVWVNEGREYTYDKYKRVL